MLETVRELENDLDDFGAMGIDEDDYFDPEDGPKIVAQQLETRALIKQCQNEIEASFKNAASSSRDEDLVGWLAEELRREFLSRYLAGLEERDAVLENLAEGTLIQARVRLDDKGFYRKRAVDRIARINEGLLRRQKQKDKRGAEN